MNSDFATNLQPSTVSIRYKFISTMIWVLLSGTIVLSLTIAVNEWSVQQKLLMKKGAGLAQYVAKICLDPLIMNDTIQLDTIVNEARYDEEILYTVIIDKNGDFKTSQFASINYASPRVALLKEKLHDIRELVQLLEFISSNESSVVVTVPVITGNETIGQVVVCLSKHNLIYNILRTVAVIIALNAVVAIVLAMLLFFVSRKNIFTPITELAKASRQLATGDLATRLTTTAIGEMQQLIDSFNKMAEDLQQTTVSKEYVNNIIQSMTEALIIITPEYRIREANDAASVLLGYEQGELPGLQAGMLFDATLLLQITTGPDQGQRICKESWCKRQDGRTIPIYFTASVMRDADGVIQGIVCTALDISAMKQVSEQLAATNQALQLEVEQRKMAQEEASWLNTDLEYQKSALEAANRELESFCYSVSHDLRAPLRHINGFTTILSEDYRENLDDLGRDCLDRICTASSHMGTLIDDLLRFSRVSRADIKIVDVNLSDSARKISAMFRESEPERTTAIEIADGLAARGDATMLDMVLQNLIGNAWKYSSGTPAAVITVDKMQQQGLDVFFVRDTGVGFDMSYKDKLFRVFERLHGEEFEGTGIGLATVQRIIERHGGRIWAEGAVGKGATFYFTLPG